MTPERRRLEEQLAAEAWLCGELPGSAVAPLRRVRNVVADLSEYRPVEEEESGRGEC